MNVIQEFSDGLLSSLNGNRSVKKLSLMRCQKMITYIGTLKCELVSILYFLAQDSNRI
jgi:hypothetical protein